MYERLLIELQKATSTAGFAIKLHDTLRLSRILELLRSVGQPKAIRPEVPNYLEVQAMQTAWSVGYNQCLDDIMLFRERFIEADPKTNPPIMSFGGLDLAVSKEDLTQGEADAIRDGKPIPRIKTQHPNKT